MNLQDLVSDTLNEIIALLSFRDRFRGLALVNKALNESVMRAPLPLIPLDLIAPILDFMEDIPKFKGLNRKVNEQHRAQVQQEALEEERSLVIAQFPILARLNTRSTLEYKRFFHGKYSKYSPSDDICLERLYVPGNLLSLFFPNLKRLSFWLEIPGDSPDRVGELSVCTVICNSHTNYTMEYLIFF